MTSLPRALTSTSFALTSGWTDASQTTTSGSFGINTWPWWPETHHNHYYNGYLQPFSIERDVKVVLKFSEVDRLRKAAQKDEKLKAVLEKLTPCIEVIVDLDDGEPI